MDRGATEKQKWLPDFWTWFFPTIITIFYWHFFQHLLPNMNKYHPSFHFQSLNILHGIWICYNIWSNAHEYGTHVTLSVTFKNWPRDQGRKGKMKRDTLCCLHFCKIMALLNFCMAGAVFGWWQVGTIVWRSSYPFYKLMKENKQ